MKDLIKAILCCVLITLTNCCQTNSSEKLSQSEVQFDRITDRAENYRKRLKGEKFLLTPNKNGWSTNTMILVYNSLDCNTCIFKAVKMMDEVFFNIPDSEIFYYNIYEGEYTDNFKPLLENSKYANLHSYHKIDQSYNGFMTPFMINLNEEGEIKDAFFPLAGIEQSEDSANFINTFKQ
ncbi:MULTISPECIES: hypothetical protein [Roseivirga]|jgi:hypothetical protein|uniref:Thioredoxin-like fold domain-containing protein n=1 Tax=Roseivirga thermotolerans TaxID=1758176 RepID=A0ABQ3I655_9BACT|nr:MULTISPECIES: hypothetical protein [Roseivirga]MEC7752706.1 hypothetical protein [Bacteroidota bacterium]GHE66276.1 hypothetical protein GCM10011340_21910 [Roseivirga thermotolerans]|tara:strand:+ start:3839 stop:4375 length:537 start_codon:yes stop_codon:yes gene_type:complete